MKNRRKTLADKIYGAKVEITAKKPEKTVKKK